MQHVDLPRSRVELMLPGSDGEESACITGDPGSIPGSGLSLGVGTGYPL